MCIEGRVLLFILVLRSVARTLLLVVLQLVLAVIVEISSRRVSIRCSLRSTDGSIGSGGACNSSTEERSTPNLAVTVAYVLALLRIEASKAASRDLVEVLSASNLVASEATSAPMAAVAASTSFLKSARVLRSVA